MVGKTLGAWATPETAAGNTVGDSPGVMVIVAWLSLRKWDQRTAL
jgi:hypothetical protein